LIFCLFVCVRGRVWHFCWLGDREEKKSLWDELLEQKVNTLWTVFLIIHTRRAKAVSVKRWHHHQKHHQKQK
jgi:hypothetical protein